MGKELVSQSTAWGSLAYREMSLNNCEGERKGDGRGMEGGWKGNGRGMEALIFIVACQFSSILTFRAWSSTSAESDRFTMMEEKGETGWTPIDIRLRFIT